MVSETIEKTVYNLLMNGQYLTVYMGNQIAHTTETRKAVSNLRRKGIPVSDRWAHSNNKKFKEYFISDADRFKLLIDGRELSIPEINRVKSEQNGK